MGLFRLSDNKRTSVLSLNRQAHDTAWQVRRRSTLAEWSEYTTWGP